MIRLVKRVVQRFSSHEEAERAERAYYKSLTPQERLDIQLELIRRWREAQGEAAQRFERVYRIVKLGER